MARKTNIVITFDNLDLCSLFHGAHRTQCISHSEGHLGWCPVTIVPLHRRQDQKVLPQMASLTATDLCKVATCHKFWTIFTTSNELGLCARMDFMQSRFQSHSMQRNAAPPIGPVRLRRLHPPTVGCGAFQDLFFCSRTSTG